MRPSSTTSSLRTTSTASTRSIAEDRHRRGKEPEDDPPSLARRRPLGELTEELVVATRPLAIEIERSALAASSDSSEGSTITSAPASSPSSLSSGGVNAACTGPRRPSRRSPRHRGRRSPRSPRPSCRSVRAPPVVSASMRAQSIATFPLPITTARSCGGRTRSPGNRGGRCTRRRTPWQPDPGRSSPGMPSCRSVCAPMV